MENDAQQEKDFFVRLPLLEGVKVIREVKSAFALYFWYVARTTIESEFRGVRIGGVLGFSPHIDQSIASDLSKYGSKCSADQIRKWRRTLIRRGLIVCKRTPIGHRTMVINSAKFPHREAQALPAWAEKCLAKACFEGTVRPAKNAGCASADHLLAASLPLDGSTKSSGSFDLTGART